MHARLGDQIELCRKQITLAKIRAVASPHLRHDYERLEKHWTDLAMTLAFAHEVSGFLEWRARRLEPPA